MAVLKKFGNPFFVANALRMSSTVYMLRCSWNSLLEVDCNHGALSPLFEMAFPTLAVLQACIGRPQDPHDRCMAAKTQLECAMCHP
eukprot:1106459-Amphidinium_carterae.1